MMTVRETYRITVEPGANPGKAAMRMAKFIVDRWLPSNAGGVHVMITPPLADSLLPFFQRPKPTVVSVDTHRDHPIITEIR